MYLKRHAVARRYGFAISALRTKSKLRMETDLMWLPLPTLSSFCRLFKKTRSSLKTKCDRRNENYPFVEYVEEQRLQPFKNRVRSADFIPSLQDQRETSPVSAWHTVSFVDCENFQ